MVLGCLGAMTAFTYCLSSKSHDFLGVYPKGQTFFSPLGRRVPVRRVIDIDSWCKE